MCERKNTFSVMGNAGFGPVKFMNKKIECIIPVEFIKNGLIDKRIATFIKDNDIEALRISGVNVKEIRTCI